MYRLLLIALLLAAVTWMISSFDFRVDETSKIPILVDYPGDLTDWTVLGTADNVHFGLKTVSIVSARAVAGRVYRDIKLDSKLHVTGKRIGVQGVVRVKDAVVDVSLVGIESRFHVMQLSSATDKPIQVFAHVPFEGTSRKYQIEDIVRIKGPAELLRISLVLHSAGAWELESLDIFYFDESLAYITVLLFVAVAWVCLLHRMLITICGASLRVYLSGYIILVVIAVLALLPVSGIIDIFVSLLNLVTLDGYEFDSKNIDRRLISSHSISHALLTFLLLGIRKPNRLSYQEIVIVNIIIAVAIESVQSHSSFRSTEFEDLMWSCLGMGLILFTSSVLHALELSKIRDE